MLCAAGVKCTHVTPATEVALFAILAAWVRWGQSLAISVLGKNSCAVSSAEVAKQFVGSVAAPANAGRKLNDKNIKKSIWPGQYRVFIVSNKVLGRVEVLNGLKL